MEFTLEIITATLSPIVMMSAVGLVLLMMQNRYSRLKDRTLLYDRYYNILKSIESPEEHLEVVTKIRNMYLNETRLVKNAMIFAFTAIVFVIVTCISILSQEVLTLDLSYLIMFSFILALVTILITILIMAISLTMSVSTVEYEIEKMTYEIDIQIIKFRE
ncbi:MAG: DUF2721 domain-containing protein [Promethearchaeota archaeon]